MKKTNITNHKGAITDKDIVNVSCNSTGIKELKLRIGDNLFAIRKSRGWSLMQASNLIGVKKSRLDSLERGQTCMNMSRLINLANVYQVDISTLFR